MDWNDTPCSLDAELLEEGSCDDGLRRSKSVWVEKSTTNDTNEDNGEATTEDLGAVPNGSTTQHGSEISHDLCDCDCVGREVELVGQHSWVEILRSVGLYLY